MNCQWIGCERTPAFTTLQALVAHLLDVHLTGNGNNLHESHETSLPALEMIRPSTESGLQADESTLGGGPRPSNTNGAFMCQWQGCNRIGIPLATKSSLIAHLRVHTGEKPFICGQTEHATSDSLESTTDAELPIASSASSLSTVMGGCGKAFSRSDALSRHQKQCPAKFQDLVKGNTDQVKDSSLGFIQVKDHRKNQVLMNATDQAKDHLLTNEPNLDESSSTSYALISDGDSQVPIIANKKRKLSLKLPQKNERQELFSTSTPPTTTDLDPLNSIAQDLQYWNIPLLEYTPNEPQCLKLVNNSSVSIDPASNILSNTTPYLNFLAELQCYKGFLKEQENVKLELETIRRQVNFLRNLIKN